MPDVQQVLTMYLITFGWAVVGGVSMGVSLLIALKVFALGTRGVDEWQLVKDGNRPMGYILAAVVLAVGIVVASITRAG